MLTENDHNVLQIFRLPNLLSCQQRRQQAAPTGTVSTLQIQKSQVSSQTPSETHIPKNVWNISFNAKKGDAEERERSTPVNPVQILERLHEHDDAASAALKSIEAGNEVAQSSYNDTKACVLLDKDCNLQMPQKSKQNDVMSANGQSFLSDLNSEETRADEACKSNDFMLQQLSMQLSMQQRERDKAQAPSAATTENRPPWMTLNQTRNINEVNLALAHNLHVEAMHTSATNSNLQSVSKFKVMEAKHEAVSSSVSNGQLQEFAVDAPTESPKMVQVNTVQSRAEKAEAEPLYAEPGVCHIHTHSLKFESILNLNGKSVRNSREVEVLKVHQDPEIVVMPNFLTQEECEELLQQAEGNYERSKTSKGLVSAPQTSYALSEGCIRTSSSSHLPKGFSSLTDRIEKRVAYVSGSVADNVEPLVVVKYQPGEFFKEHHDGFFRPTTVLVYLNDVIEGGETDFTHLGFKVVPRKGMAVMWKNTLPDLSPDYRLKHSGLPPLKGIKYCVNCFVNISTQVIYESAPKQDETHAKKHFGANEESTTNTTSSNITLDFGAFNQKDPSLQQQLQRENLEHISQPRTLSQVVFPELKLFDFYSPLYASPDCRTYSLKHNPSHYQQSHELTRQWSVPTEISATTSQQNYKRCQSEVDYVKFEKLLQIHRYLKKQQKSSLEVVLEEDTDQLNSS